MSKQNLNTEKLNISENEKFPVDCLVGLPTKPFRHLDLFSGIGGFALAAKSIWKKRYENVGFCEIDKFCQKVLRKNFGNDIKIIDDIRNLRKENINGTINLLTGGFPCQPFSTAGKQKGTSDNRYLWDEMFRVIKETNPHWILGENVAGIINMELDNVLADLENAGYETQTFVIPACAVNAPHRRDRVWIIGYTEHNGWDGTENRQSRNKGSNGNTKRTNEVCESARSNISWHYVKIARTEREFYERFAETNTWDEHWEKAASRLCRMDDGIPNRVDRIKGLGNAIVPQIAMVLLAALKTVDDNLVEL